MLVFCCWRWTQRVLPAGRVFSTRLTAGVGSARETSVLVLFRTRGCKWQSQLQLAEDWREFTVSCPQSAGRLAVTQPWGQLDARTASSTSCFWCLSLLASSCLARFYHHKSWGGPRCASSERGWMLWSLFPSPEILGRPEAGIHHVHPESRSQRKAAGPLEPHVQSGRKTRLAEAE